jgi:hypothetical protein
MTTFDATAPVRGTIEALEKVMGELAWVSDQVDEQARAGDDQPNADLRRAGEAAAEAHVAIDTAQDALEKAHVQLLACKRRIELGVQAGNR